MDCTLKSGELNDMQIIPKNLFEMIETSDVKSQGRACLVGHPGLAGRKLEEGGGG